MSLRKEKNKLEDLDITSEGDLNTWLNIDTKYKSLEVKLK